MKQPFRNMYFLSKSTRHISISLIILAVFIGYWLLPIQGQVFIVAEPAQVSSGVWPQIWADPQTSRASDPVTIYIRDNVPWAHIKLLVDGAEVMRDEFYNAGSGPWIWRWHIPAQSDVRHTAIFYHSCQTGCIKRGQFSFSIPTSLDTDRVSLKPTKLGVVFADPKRNWHGRSGWTVELTYAERQTDDVDFSIDGLAQRVQQASQHGLRVLVRVAYDRKQALPPTDDEVALKNFLSYCARLVRDDRLQDVYGYIIGAGYNTFNENTLAPNRPVTPEWYARLFNGYGVDTNRTDNIVQTMRAINPRIRILVGPVVPWSSDQNGKLIDPHDLPWLNYMNTLVAYIDMANRARVELGIPLAGPDGFALRSAGRIDAPSVAAIPATEPSTNLYHPDWGTGQAGFRVYRDWLDIINRYPTTRGLPAYITSTNTTAGEASTPPTQSYPAGWLTSAVAEISSEAQIQALCWFVDEPLGGLWEDFSLQQAPGHLYDAATEFDQLLQQ